MTGSRLVQLSGVIVDLIYQIAELPYPGGEADVEHCMIATGGGFNAMLAASRGGMEVAYGGAIGNGLFAAIVKETLDEAKMAILQAPLVGLDQGSCVVLIDNHGERTFISQSGADGVLDQAQLDALDIMADDWLLVSGYPLSHTNSQQAIYRWLSNLQPSIPLFFDPAPVATKIPAHTRELLLASAEWVSANCDEARRLSGAATPSTAAEKLFAGKSGNTGGVVVRDGRHGCWVACDHGPATHVPGYIVDTIDTNGAGDTHLGAFIAALNRAFEPLHAAKFANAAAAISTTRRGPATAPAFEETLAFLGDKQTCNDSS